MSSGEFTEVHRALVTLIRTSRYCSVSELTQYLRRVSQAISPDTIEVTNDSIETVLNNHIATINYRLNQHGFKIDKKSHEITGELYYIFINISNDDIVKANPAFSAKELECIVLLIDDIVGTDRMFSLGKVNAQQRVANNMNKTLKEAEFFIVRLIDEGWFVLTKDERILLSLRALSELKQYLIARYGVNSAESEGKVYVCEQCNELVTLGHLLRSTLQAFHYKCYDVYLDNYSGEIDDVTVIGVDPSTVI